MKRLLKTKSLQHPVFVALDTPFSCLSKLTNEMWPMAEENNNHVLTPFDATLSFVGAI